jgi:hypothetical protein
MILHFTGTTWTRERSGTGPIRAIWGTSATDIFSDNCHYDGTTWTYMDMTTHRVWDIWGTSASDVYLVNASQVVKHYDGTTWERIYVHPTSTWLRGMWGEADTNMYVVGDDGLIVHYSCSRPVPDIELPLKIVLLILFPVSCWILLNFFRQSTQG